MPDGVPTWEEVARDHGRFLFTVGYRLAGNEADAADLAQEALLRVRRGLETYRPMGSADGRPSGSLEAWLARIVTNVFLDEVRRKRRRPSVALPEQPDLVLPPSPAADVAAASERLSEETQAALAALSEEFRVAIVLCDVVGLTYEEIGEHQRVPVGTVRSRIHRGRLQLRTLLTEAES
jgi:RNA polymerase sigma-70 factor (ECF subfamily)